MGSVSIRLALQAALSESKAFIAFVQKVNFMFTTTYNMFPVPPHELEQRPGNHRVRQDLLPWF